MTEKLIDTPLDPNCKPCPWCKGTGKDDNAGYKCFICAGYGTVSASWTDAEKLVQRCRDRLAREMTLRQEAARLGISAKELSDRESGRT